LLTGDSSVATALRARAERMDDDLMMGAGPGNR